MQHYRHAYNDEPRDWNPVKEPIPLSMRANTKDIYLADDDTKYGPPGNRKPGVVEYEARKMMEGVGNGNATAAGLPNSIRRPVDSTTMYPVSNQTLPYTPPPVINDPLADMTGVPIAQGDPNYLRAQQNLMNHRLDDQRGFEAMKNLSGNKNIATSTELLISRDYGVGNGLINAFVKNCPEAADRVTRDLKKSEQEWKRLSPQFRTDPSPGYEYSGSMKNNPGKSYYPDYVINPLPFDPKTD